MLEIHFPWTECSILLLVVSAVLITMLKDRDQARRWSIAICCLVLGMMLAEWGEFIHLGAVEARERWDVFQLVYGKPLFVVDTLSAPLLPLGALLYLMAVLSTLRTKIYRFSFGWTLASEALLLATFSSREPWIIVILLSAAMIPPWMELRRRQRATRVFVLHAGLYVTLLLVGQSLVPAGASPSHPPILAATMLGAALLMRTGVVPVHCWITDLFEKAVFGTALLFVTPMTGVYGIIRILMPIAPEWGLRTVAILSLITAVYAAGMALVQHETRRFYCFLFLSQSSLVLVGLETVTPLGLTGALCVWASVSISMLGFGLTLRSIESRISRLSLDSYHGLYSHIPSLAALFLVTGLSSTGFPGTLGFVGSELLIDSVIGIFPVGGVMVVVATALNSIAVLFCYFRLFTGTQRHASVSLEARWAEKIAVLVLIAILVGGGLWPHPGVISRYQAAREIMTHAGQSPSYHSEAPPANAKPD